MKATVLSSDIDKAATLLGKGKLVSIPTETVYGLAANIFDEEAIKGIFTLKKRPLFNPLIIHIHSFSQLEELAEKLPEKAKLLAHKFWPGELTLVLKKKDIVPDLVTANKDTVALRMPNHKLLRELLKKINFPLAAPSANPFGSISPTTAERVKNYFEGELDMVLDGGDCQSGIESTIIGFEDGEVVLYRLGALALEDIESVVGTVKVKSNNDSNPDAPGMLSKHYSPSTSIVLAEDIQKHISINKDKKLGVLSFSNTVEHPSVQSNEVLSFNKDYKESSRNLYEALHRLDNSSLELIIAELLPNKGLGITINDRLRRAAAQ